MLRALILALLWKGSLPQDSGYSLMVPQMVSVQEGLCVLVPCTFTYPAQYDTWNPHTQLHGHWYKYPAIVGRDPPVASSDPSQVVSQKTHGRFRLVGDLVHGNCSLQINNIQWADEGRYFFRVQRGILQYTYRFTPSYYNKQSYTDLPKTLVDGDPVTMTCRTPERYSGTPPRIPWTGPFTASWLLCRGSLTGSNPSAPLPGLVIRGDDGDVETEEGDSLTLICEADSRLVDTLRWVKANETLSPGQGGVRHLDLSNLSRGDAGEYWCLVKNPYGSASWALHVHVQCKALEGHLRCWAAGRQCVTLWRRHQLTLITNACRTTHKPAALRASLSLPRAKVSQRNF
uniref:Ig-like domain-containing protein n=1 Tax=Pelusios castaneus TaxID=367368 RepID=A0A8C8SCK0_9SAUR